ncbi:S8 family peptidase [Methylobacterium indicum]|uniref:S8 family peptidase n=1 Tax=Methylobacterium indicum TaxID=1775910 RepID=UPI001FCAB154|nr:S8 family peptidase [Methylobacterium indicum]
MDGLENRTKGIEIVAVAPISQDAEVVQTTVFVPERAADHFVQKVTEYRDKNNKKSGRPKNEKLVASIQDARLAGVRALFTDALGTFPGDNEEIWWEVWIRGERKPEFERAAGRLGIALKDQALGFPERVVILALGTPTLMQILIERTDGVAEFRRAKDVPTFFLEMEAHEAADWVDELEKRMQTAPVEAPAICVLDSGATRGHPLLRASLAAADQHAYDPQWSLAEHRTWNGHGTGMAGIALLGDIEAALSQTGPIVVGHRLETVKILPDRGATDPKLYGAVTAVSVGHVERQAPFRRRVICMAVSSLIGVSRGRPSSWSAAVDQLCYNISAPRLMILAAGNLSGDILHTTYPDANDLQEVANPGQAWNPLVVGACTDKITIADPTLVGWSAIAPAGELSPVSRTSTIWDRQWPIRPDVVFEGGNLAHDGTNPGDPVDDLQLITTHYEPQNRLLKSFGDTSGATALAANMAARIMTAQPTLWPETVRALMVHSAEWTQPMRQRFQAAASRAEKFALLRRYGWGVPSLDRALASAANDATLLVQDALLPFFMEKSRVKTRHMNLHRLPWPRDELSALGELEVELRVTLSYFIEPNPGERGWTRRHRYASHGLRFAVKRALEGRRQFESRINKAAEIEEQGDAHVSDTGGDDWFLGFPRDRGSIHSDIWRGTAAELASRDAIAVYPVSGWWKEKPNLQRWDRSVRYALLVSIRAPGADIDIYTPIVAQIGVPVPAA